MRTREGCPTGRAVRQDHRSRAAGPAWAFRSGGTALGIDAPAHRSGGDRLRRVLRLDPRKRQSQNPRPGARDRRANPGLGRAGDRGPAPAFLARKVPTWSGSPRLRRSRSQCGIFSDKSRVFRFTACSAARFASESRFTPTTAPSRGATPRPASRARFKPRRWGSRPSSGTLSSSAAPRRSQLWRKKLSKCAPSMTRSVPR